MSCLRLGWSARITVMVATMKKLSRLAYAVPALLAGSAFAEGASALETAATTAIGSAKTSAETILVAAIAIVGAFVLYKIIKRAFNKA